MLNLLNGGVDLDCVLRPFLHGLCTYYNRNYDYIAASFPEVEFVPPVLSPKDFIENGYWRVWGGTREVAIAIVAKFYETPLFRDMEPFPGAVEFLRKLQEGGSNPVIVTSCYAGEELTMAYIKEHFQAHLERELPVIFHGYGGNETKGEICARNGLGWLLDDGLANIYSCLEHGVAPILFNYRGEYPYITKRSEDPCPIHVVETFEGAFGIVQEISLPRGGVEQGY